MKKLIWIGVVVIVIFVLIAVLTNLSNDKKLANNPYGTDNLQQETIDQLDDENYQNIVLPEDLQKQIESGKAVTAYFFSPTCPHCKKMTPIMMPIAKEMKVDVQQFNLLEFEDGWNQYGIEYTPTLVFYKDGKEVSRMVGEQPEENIRGFFNEVVLK